MKGVFENRTLTLVRDRPIVPRFIALNIDLTIEEMPRRFAHGDPIAASREMTLASPSNAHSQKEIDRMEGTLLAHCGAAKIGREELALVPSPPGTTTHKVIPHHEVINALVDTLSLRHIAPVREEYAVSKDGMKMFGIMELETTFQGCRFALGIRNAHDKSMRLAMTVGYRVLVCDNMAFSGDFTPVLAKHSKNFNLIQSLDIGVSEMQRNFDPMTKQVARWRDSQLTDVSAKLIIYQAFIEGDVDLPKHLAGPVHNLYFNPEHEEFAPRTMFSLSNAFTSALKQLDPVPQFRATAKLGPFLETRAVIS